MVMAYAEISREVNSSLFEQLVPCKFCKQKCTKIEVHIPVADEDGDQILIHAYSDCQLGPDPPNGPDGDVVAEIDVGVNGRSFKQIVEQWNWLHSNLDATNWPDS